MKYKKLTIEVAEKDYERLKKSLEIIESHRGRLVVDGYYWGDNNDRFAFGVKFRMPKRKT